jgi:pimeloyl-ACP methyl ester carboxylesterase
MTTHAVEEKPTLFPGPSGWLAYTRAGSGPPVVLIHGLGCSRRTWRHIASRLAQTRTVIAVDLPGHGESDAPRGDYSPGAMATAVRDLLQSLGIRRTDLVGHSLGGGITIAFAHLFPELTGSIVLIGSAGLGPEVTLMLRAVTLPGVDRTLGLLARLPDPVLRRGTDALTLLPGSSRRTTSRHCTTPSRCSVPTRPARRSCARRAL